MTTPDVLTYRRDDSVPWSHISCSTMRFFPLGQEGEGRGDGELVGFGGCGVTSSRRIRTIDTDPERVKNFLPNQRVKTIKHKAMQSVFHTQPSIQYSNVMLDWRSIGNKIGKHRAAASAVSADAVQPHLWIPNGNKNGHGPRPTSHGHDLPPQRHIGSSQFSIFLRGPPHAMSVLLNSAFSFPGPLAGATSCNTV